MPTLPTFQDLYDTGRAELEGDPVYQFLDWTAGSWGDAFTMIVAACAQTVLRYTNARFLTAFISTATGADLDYLALDRYGVARNPGESDEDYRTRILLEVQNLARATVPALLAFALADADVIGATVTEDLEHGITTITVTLASGAVSATVLDRLRAELPSWKAAGTTVAIVEA